jgi:hypothetical protein
MNGYVRIEQMGEANAVGLGQQPEQSAVTVERPRPAGAGDLKDRLIGAVDEPLLRGTGRIPKGNVDRLVSEPFDLDDRRQPVSSEAAN